IWAEVLGVEQVGRHDNFFELGGHSLLAVRMLSLVRERFAAEVSLANVFSVPSVARFAETVARAQQPSLPAIVAVQHTQGADIPLSSNQQRLWFLTQLQGASAAYNMPSALELRGPLDLAALRRSLDALVARHASLRTAFVAMNGAPIQQIDAVGDAFPFAFDDLSDAPESASILPVLLEFEATAPFDLGQSPLARARLIRLAGQHHVLALNMHHIVSDAWSIAVLIRELQALYAGFLEDRHAALPALPIQYADYALWQRQWLSHEALAAQADYWRDRLSGAPAVLELPGDRPRPTVQDFAGDSVPLVIDAALTARLKVLSQQNGVTLYMTILSAWSVLLSRLSGQSDLVIGTPTANRPRLELEGLIGFFVNTLALRIDTSGSPSVAELLQRVRSAALGAQQHQDLPFEQIVEILRPTRSLSHSPVFQVMLSWQDMEHADLSLAALAVQPLQTAAPFAKFDLTLNLGEHDDTLQGSLNYATALFDRSTIERFAGYLQTILSAMLENSVQRVDALPLLPPEERQTLLVDWNATAKPFPAQRCIHELFEAQVEQRPDATAVCQDDRSVSYRTLNAQANRLARHLREQGVGPGVPVAICMERSPEMMVGLMAILKAGGAYVPLDPSYPADRLAFMLADIVAPLVLTHASAQDSLQAALAELALAPAVIDLLADADAWSAQDATNLGPAPIALNSRDVAYIIYTSGSTGVPKGVLIEHHSLVNRLVWMQNTYGFGPDSRILQKTPITFDVSVWELFGPLIAGACLVLARPHGHKDPSYLIALIKEQRISIVHFVPSMLQAFIDTEGSSGCTSLEHVFCSGEALPSTLARRCLERLESTQLHNLYGPTEATVDVTSWTCPRPFDEDQQVVIGKPIDNVRTYILDPSGEPTPIGAVGELHLAGTCLARGYHNRPELTRDRFITRPLVAGERMYRTGDLARYRANGDIEYIGRNDFQVKLRGFRIELGEIEAQLASCTGVREAVVLVREDSPGDKRLVAYYTTGGAATPSHEGLSARLGAVLPDYMVPAAYIALEAMPLTDNGKLDRTALPAPDRQTYLSKPYEAPAGDIEVALAGIWTEVLGIGNIGRHDNFFELGGHSLLAVRMLERMKQSNLHANVLTVFKAPVLMQLAQVLQEETGGSHDALPPAVPAGTERITPDMVPLAGLGQEDIDYIAASVAGGMANIQDIYPLTHLQEGILFHHLMETQSDPYLMWSLVRFGERHALDAYIAALQTVIARHDICRTAVVWEGLISPVQVVWRDAPLQVEILEFDAAAGDVASQLLDHVDPRHYRLDLRTAPLTRIYAARDSSSNQWLVLRLVHHLIDDVTTAQLLNNEVMTLLHGNGASLPAPLPFKHVVARARHERGNVEDEAFFRTMLGGVTEPTAPFNLLNVHGDGTHVVEARHRLPATLSQQIRRRSKQLGVSAASLFHVAWAQVVARTAGRADAVFGTVLFGRMSLNESADRVFGPFINTLPILIGVEGVRASEGVRQTHQRLTELMSHEHASLALAQRCSGVAAPAPLFTAILNYRHAINERQDAGGTNTLEDVEELVSEERTNYPLVLNVDDIEDDFLTTVQVMPAVDPHLVAAMVRTALESLIHALDQDPESELQTLSVLPAEERHRILVDWNATAAPYPAKRCIHEL
ncbi:hypothetical protein GW16_00015, partial [Xanthomonas arboricola pv. celebensis]|uniref:non-ribosomal peptide synthetase n=1 Tax=Xanthomonas arboricola TaxID=56448 RepID=UPI0004D74447